MENALGNNPQREQCWITDLVKVFLFKKGHIERYQKLEANGPDGYTRERFFELGEKSMSWLEEELLVAKPKFMITLGAEVAGILHGVHSSSAQSKLLMPEPIKLDIREITVSVMHCAHPGILMRKDPKNPWPVKHNNEYLPALRKALLDFIK